MLADGGYLELAEQLYKKGDYRRALQAYQRALNEESPNADLIRFNIAQCWMALDTTVKSEEIYREVVGRLPDAQRSIALSNLAIIETRRGRPDRALEMFRQALIADDRNDNARFNYELLKKRKLNEPPPPPPPPPPPSQTPPPPRKPQENVGGSRRIEMTAEEAEQTLQKLRTQEKQYLQEQRKRAKVRTRYSDGPDW